MGILTELILQPAVLVSLMVLLGLVFQRKGFSALVTGVTKTLVGYEMIVYGGSIISQAADPLMKMLSQGFHVSGTVINVEAATGVVVEKYGLDVSLIMITGLIVNLILARISRYHYVFLTGHQTLFMASAVVCVLRASGISGVKEILCGALAVGIAMVLSPAMLQRYTRRICNNDKAAMGHFGSVAYLLAAWMGKLFGNKNNSVENVRIPRWLAFIRDTSVILFTTMVMMNLAAAAACGSKYVETLSGGQNYLIYAVREAVFFTIGFVTISTGVRWMIDEIVPAVRGIAMVWVPDAIPTIDCPLVFPYAPNSLALGFLSSFIGGILSMWIMVVCDLPVILPGAVPHFFCGATAGVYGNSTGGVRGAALGGFVNGIMISFLPIMSFPFIGTMSKAGVAFADTDFGVVTILLGLWIRRVGIYGTMAILICIILLMILFPQSIRDRDKGEHWFIEEKNKDVYK